jgi:transposase
MLDGMRKDKNKSYVPEPAIPSEMEERYRVIRAVLARDLSVTDGAAQLGLSRNHFQTLLHRAMEGMLAGMTPKPAGRPATPPREAALTDENQRLRRENQRLQERVATIDRLLGVAGDLLTGRTPLRGRAKRSKLQPPTEGGDEDDEPARRLDGAETMIALSVPTPVVAAAVGRSVATLGRWRRRKRRAEPLVGRRGPRTPRALDPAARSEVAERVRDLRGLVGAESLARSVPGVSRRRAATIKRETLTAMERERVASCGRVTVLAPAVVRGFDQLEVDAGGRVWVLVSADGAVPFRTSAPIVDAYDGTAVAAAIEHDFAVHGAPLVWRRDRARSHGTDAVTEVIDHYQVLPLAGPPRCPRFYGQLERQNREHRAWLRLSPPRDRDQLATALPEMLAALNARWRRRTLGWKTAEEAWMARPALQLDRARLRDEVRDRSARISRHLANRGLPSDLADRLAIEQTLIRYGLLRIQLGVRC